MSVQQTHPNIDIQLGQFGNGLLRQSEEGTGPSVDVEDSSDDEVRCIPKVMQVRKDESTK